MFTYRDPGLLRDRDLTLRLTETSFDSQMGHCYHFDMVHSDSGERMGGCVLRISEEEYVVLWAGHIGYGVHPDFRGNRYAARACRLLLPLARQHGIDPVWITNNPENLASRRSCELAGAVYVETVDVPEWVDIFQEGEPKKCRYRLSE
jgi:tagatose 1,6-diphosphate aldolase